MPSHPLHKLNKHQAMPRPIRPSIFQSDDTYQIRTDPTTVTAEHINQNLKTIHSNIVEKYLTERQPNKIINQQAPKINKEEEQLTRKIRRTLAQIRTGKSPLLLTYKHTIDPHTYPTATCPLCKTHEHNTTHLFNCTHIPTQLVPLDLWSNPVGAAALLDTWEQGLAGP